MSQKWKLQDIKPAQKKKSARPSTQHQTPSEQPAQRPERPERERAEDVGQSGLHSDPTPLSLDQEDIEQPMRGYDRGDKTKKRRNLMIAAGLFVVIVGVGLLASLLLVGAEVNVTPRTATPNVNAEFTAHIEPAAGELGYELMTLEAQSERQVTATGEETVEEQATGVIEIVKTTPSSERLIKNTRFESPDGLVFKINESIEVPGATTNADGEEVPGRIRTEVFAESPGEEYNLQAGTRFTIPGFAEGGFDELFNSMYAENPTAMDGGYNGPRFIIADEELTEATKALQEELRGTLKDRIAEEQPAGFVVFPEAAAVTFSTEPAAASDGEQVTITEKATLRIPLFKDDAFASFLAAATVPGYEGAEVRLSDPTALSFAYATSTTASTNLDATSSLTFSLAGDPQLVWEYDKVRLKADLAGMEHTALNGVLDKYPAIAEANAYIRPFWKRSFPADADDITITEVLEAAEEADTNE